MGLNHVNRSVVSELQGRSANFFMHNGCLVKSSNVLKEQNSFRKLASVFGDHLLL
jgi:hypothetical protein